MQNLLKDILLMILEKDIYDYRKEYWNDDVYNKLNTMGNNLHLMGMYTINEGYVYHERSCKIIKCLQKIVFVTSQNLKMVD